MKIDLLRGKNAQASIWGQTRTVAKLFGVNSRTIKYVWNRQTWSHATEYLWASESELQESSESRRPRKVNPNYFHALNDVLFYSLLILL